ncbi:hypothetical protein H311_01269 [Anncaliia algerae PRA109]|nr:hypothetical protein H311_01269 [Anncaliia algerae PRA109]
MNIFEMLDYMLEYIHDYPHKAGHYNRSILTNLSKYKSKYRKYLKRYLKSFKKDDKVKRKFKKNNKKINEFLERKIENTKKMIELTNKIINKFKELVETHDLPIDLDLPQIANIPNVIKAEEGGGVYCECKTSSNGDMILCDSVKCKIKWFHFKCVGITSAPKGSWYCSECKKDWRLSRLD